MAYSIQYTIGVLTGAYAQKYSVIIYDAARLEGLLKAVSSPLYVIASEGGRREFDPFECFNGLMKLLKREGKKQFCQSIVRVDAAGRRAARGLRMRMRKARLPWRRTVLVACFAGAMR